MTTKGHFGAKDLYKYSLKNFNSFNLQENFDKYLSIKVFKGDEELAQQISKEFNYKTFAWYNPDPNINDESPYKDYGYYLLTNYLADIVNVYSQEELLKNDLEENKSATDNLEEEEKPKQIQAPRKKKTLNENQKKAVAENLKKGREALAKKTRTTA